jgi:hypothetical protein
MAEKRAPTVMNLFSETLKRALPTKGLRTSAETLKVPIKTPISASLDPDLAR